LNDRIEQSAETEAPIDHHTCQCPACGNGTMMTILVLDGFGNVVKDAGSETEVALGIKAAKSWLWNTDFSAFTRGINTESSTRSM
jgi:hypothetical protein